MPAEEKKKESETITQEIPVALKRLREKDLFTWRAAARPFKKRGRDFWVTVIAIASLASFVMFLIEGVMPVVLIIALVFLFYVLSTVEPDSIEYKITNKGVKIADRTNGWDLFTRYWFSKRFESNLLVFEMLTLPGRLEMVINPKDKDSLKKVISDYIPEEKAPPSNLDKTANWFSRKLPQ